MRAATLGTTTSSASFESASRTTCADRSCCVFFTGFISLLLAFGPIWILRPPPSELSRSWVLIRNSQRPVFSAAHSRWQAPVRARGPLLAGEPAPGGREHRSARSRRFAPADGLLLSAARPRHPGALPSPPSTRVDCLLAAAGRDRDSRQTGHRQLAPLARPRPNRSPCAVPTA